MYAYLKYMEDSSEICDENIFNKKNSLENLLKKQRDTLENIIIKFIKNNIIKLKIMYLDIYIFLNYIIKKYFNIITVKKIYNGYIFIMPYKYVEKNENYNFNEQKQKLKNIEKEKVRKKIEEKTLKNIFKIKKIYKKYNITDIVLSNKIKDINNSKNIMKYMIKEVLEYILKIQDKKIQLQDIYLLVEEYNKFNENNIIFLSEYFRTINIITSKINEYKKLASIIEEKCSSLITVTNNKIKSLKNAKYIINIDYNEDKINEYVINRNAIILNIPKEIINIRKGFNGINISNIEINVCKDIIKYFDCKKMLNQFNLLELYNSIIVEKKEFYDIRQQLIKDNVEIMGLCGINGKIEKNEYGELEK